MSGNQHAKIGLVPVSLAGERVDLAEKFYDQALLNLSANDLEILGKFSPCLTDEEVMAASRQVADEGADCLVFLIGTWIYAPSIIFSLSHLNLPIAVWGVPEPSSFSSVGANVIHGSMDELGIKHKLLYGFPDEKEVAEQISIFARASQVKAALLNSRLGVIGGRSLGMYPSTTDPLQVRNLFGIEIEHVDQLLLVEYAKELSDKEVIPFFQQMQADYGSINVPEPVMLKSIKLYFALKRLVKERNLSFIGVKCLEEVVNQYTSCCLAISLLNNSGMVTACQSDINAAIVMKILQILTCQPVIFADLNNINRSTRVARLVNCGTMPTALAENFKSVDWGFQYEYMGKERGACPVFCCHSGQVTLGGLSRIKGEYVFQIATGTAFEQPREIFGEVRDIWPQAFIRLDSDPDWFYQNLRSNHIVAGYSNVKKELMELSDLLNIRTVTDSEFSDNRYFQ
jgi:L-fucose isomerase